MSTQVQLRRGTTAQHSSFTGALAEVTVDTDKKTLVVHDGSTVGGFPMLSEAATDASTFGFVLDEDDMASDSAQKVPTQQSVKAYVNNTGARGNVNTDLTVTVGTGGEFSTINEALESLSKKYPSYASGGRAVIISLQSGFAMAEQVIVKDCDLSWITITSVDEEVSITRSALTDKIDLDASGGVTIGDYPAFGALRAKLPTIGCLFSMDASGTADDRSGVFCANGSKIDVLPGCGIKNAAHTGIYCLNASFGNAPATVWSGAGNCCVRAESVSMIALASGYSVAETPGAGFGADCRDSGGDGILAKEASFIDARAANVTGTFNDAIHARRGSTVNATQARVSSTNMTGVRSDRCSTIYFNLGEVTGAGTSAILCSRNSRVDCESAVITGPHPTAGVQAWQASTVNANACTISITGDSSASSAFHAIDGSTINANGATGDNHSNGFRAETGSIINAIGGSATGCTTGVNARQGSTINANGVTATGYTTNGMLAFEGSTINARGANARKAGSDATSDFAVSRGSILNVSDSRTGGVSQTVNTLTTNGVIFG